MANEDNLLPRLKMLISDEGQDFKSFTKENRLLAWVMVVLFTASVLVAPKALEMHFSNQWVQSNSNEQVVHLFKGGEAERANQPRFSPVLPEGPQK